MVVLSTLTIGGIRSIFTVSTTSTFVVSTLCASVLAVRARRAAHSKMAFFIVCLVLLFPFNLLFHFCIFTAHRCGVALQGCKMAAHRCGGLCTAVNRPRTGAGSIARLQNDRARVRGALHGCFGIPHLCGGRFTLRRPPCRRARRPRRAAAPSCSCAGRSSRACGSIRGLRPCASRGRRPRARRG